MKTRNILMFTASVTSLSSISTADSDNMLAIEQGAPAIAVAAASNAVVQEVVMPQPALAETVAAIAALAALPAVEAAKIEMAALTANG